MDPSTPPTSTALNPGRAQATATAVLVALLVTLVVLAGSLGPVRAYAAVVDPVGLGTAATYSVLGGQTVTNVPPSRLPGDLGVFPGTAVTGFTPEQVGGATNEGNAAAEQAQLDLTAAYLDAEGRAPTGSISAELGSTTPRVGGVYKAASAVNLTGPLILDGEGNPNAVFIFQIPSAFITSTGSSVVLTNAARACNVFFQVGSSATIGVGSQFVGTVMALQSITVETGATVDGRALARNGAVTLDKNVFAPTGCALASPSSSATPSVSVSPTLSASPSVTTTESVSPSASVTASESSSPSVTASPSASVTASESSSPSASVTASESSGPSASVTASQSSTPTVISETELLTEGPSVGATETEMELETEGPSDTGSALEVGDTDRSGGGGGLAQTGSSGLTTAVAMGGVALLLAAAGVLGAARLRSRMGGHE